jgi:hypothetical protein
MQLTVGRKVLIWLAGAGVCSLVLAKVATAESPERYPYDPACAWGRLADGHGMLIRCLEPAEASVLLESKLEVNTKPAAKKASGDEPADKSKAATTPEKGGGSKGGKLVVSNVGPAQADAGELPLAAKKLGLPKDRYIDCVEKNGGLTADTAKVVVRFLVRERGRAEGVSVKSRKGMSKAAAACIADVVDRRYVGYPAAPMVGATIPIELSIKR